MNNTDTETNRLFLVVDALIDDLFATPDNELLQEVREDGLDVECFIAEAKELWGSAQRTAGKRKLQAAKQQLAAPQSDSNVARSAMDIGAARAILERLKASNSDFGEGVTLAARDLRELSDDDVLSIVSALEELGAIPKDDKKR